MVDNFVDMHNGKNDEGDQTRVDGQTGIFRSCACREKNDEDSINSKPACEPIGGSSKNT